jgi:hypothetical protein
MRQTLLAQAENLSKTYVDGHSIATSDRSQGNNINLSAIESPSSFTLHI